MNKRASAPAWTKTRSAPDYRSFLRAYLEESSRTLSELARSSRFGRGFPGDVISGKRRLTARSFPAFEKALQVPAPGKRLFRYLVAKEESDILPGIDRDKLDPAIEELRIRPWRTDRKQIATKDVPTSRTLYAHPDHFAVYAAAGGPENGASRDQIIARTRLAEGAVDRALRSLISAGVLVQVDQFYRPESTHVFLKLNERDEYFSRLFQLVAQKAANRAPNGMQSDREFYFTSAFCVNETKLPELKAALRSTMLRFVDESIESEGDRLVQLVTSLF